MRMIDGDKFKEDLLKLWDYSSVDGITATTVLKQVISDLDNAPTVSEITKEKLSIAYDQGYKDGRDNWLQEEHKGDLISREALTEEMRKSINERYPKWDKPITVADIATLIFDVIDNAPTVNIPNYGGEVVPDMLQGWKYEEKGGAV